LNGAEFLGVFGIIRQRLVDLAYQQVLAIAQSGDSFFFGVHFLNLSICVSSQ
jgi:hypothetical protein